MLTGVELGNAIAEAIRLKGVPKTAVARHFGIKGPSVYDWINHGRIGKQHLTELVNYFSDVVPPSHWGLDLAEANSPAEPPSHAARLPPATIRRIIEAVKEGWESNFGWTFSLSTDEELDLLADAIAVALAEAESLANGDVDERGQPVEPTRRIGGSARTKKTGEDRRPEVGRAKKSA